MPLVSAKCTNCGANLKIDNTKDAAICPYCNSAFIVEKAINNYNTTNNITANTVNVFGGNSADFVIRAGTLEKYNGAPTVVTIPNTVSKIGDNAFKGCSGLTSVTIPNTVTQIGDQAFDGCSGLTSVTIPESITSIGSWAFNNCNSLTVLRIPSSVTSIGGGLCPNCNNLIRFIVDKNNPVFLSGASGILYNKQTRSIVEVPRRIQGAVTIANGITAIPEHAFSGCTGLTSITIPNSVTMIDSYAFLGCTGLTNVTVTNAETTIWGCNCFDNVSGSDWNDMTTYERLHNIQTVNAPEEWKRKYWGYFDCLKEYEPQKSSGCYIATAVYGSYDAPEVLVLRRFRDEVLQKSLPGRAFIKTYYFLSPPIAEKLKNSGKINAFVRSILDRWVEKLQKK